MLVTITLSFFNNVFPKPFHLQTTSCQGELKILVTSIFAFGLMFSNNLVFFCESLKIKIVWHWLSLPNNKIVDLSKLKLSLYNITVQSSRVYVPYECFRTSHISGSTKQDPKCIHVDNRHRAP